MLSKPNFILHNAINTLSAEKTNESAEIGGVINSLPIHDFRSELVCEFHRLDFIQIANITIGAQFDLGA